MVADFGGSSFFSFLFFFVQAFGVPINHFGQIQRHVAESYAEYMAGKTYLYRTANGMVRAAPVKIKRMTVGPVTLENVRASVNRADAIRSLLGMSFLGRLSGYEVRGDRMILRP